jgi:hypothetical protein
MLSALQQILIHSLDHQWHGLNKSPSCQGPTVGRAFDIEFPFHEFSTNIPPTFAREERSDSIASLDDSKEVMNSAATITRNGNSLQQASQGTMSTSLHARPSRLVEQLACLSIRASVRIAASIFDQQKVPRGSSKPSYALHFLSPEWLVEFALEL